MITMQLIQQRKHEIMQIAAKYGAHNQRVFGSVARGEARPDSDLDLLVDFEPGRTLFDLGGLLITGNGPLKQFSSGHKRDSKSIVTQERCVQCCTTIALKNI